MNDVKKMTFMEAMGKLSMAEPFSITAGREKDLDAVVYMNYAGEFAIGDPNKDGMKGQPHNALTLCCNNLFADDWEIRDKLGKRLEAQDD